jgi:hypothetical protein
MPRCEPPPDRVVIMPTLTGAALAAVATVKTAETAIPIIDFFILIPPRFYF